MNRFIEKIRRWTKRSELLAVSDDDLEKWLSSLRILNKVKRGKVHCFVCKESIDIGNLQMVSRVGGKLVFVCDKPECTYQFTRAHRKA